MIVALALLVLLLVLPALLAYLYFSGKEVKLDTRGREELRRFGLQYRKNKQTRWKHQ